MTELCAWNYGSKNDGEIKKASRKGRPEAQWLAQTSGPNFLKKFGRTQEVILQRIYRLDVGDKQITLFCEYINIKDVI